MYADSTRRIHLSIEFLSKGGNSGFLLETCKLESAVESEAIAWSPMIAVDVVFDGGLTEGGSGRVSGDLDHMRGIMLRRNPIEYAVVSSVFSKIHILSLFLTRGEV